MEKHYQKEILSAFTAVEKLFPKYEDRPQQISMAEALSSSLAEKKNLLVEAGTGVGKSFAYLIPAILSGEKTIISTASIALQEQLVNKDLSFLQQALPHEFTFALLKGKNNYLCRKRERDFVEMGEQYRGFARWASRTKTGDRDELDFVPLFWDRVCGDSEDCSASQCTFYQACFYYRHYRSIRHSDILVVNHHLLLFDLMSGFNLLPFHSQLIIDEAHQIEGVISRVFGSTLNHARVVWLLYRLRGLKIAVDTLFEPVDSFFRNVDVPARPFYPVPESIREGLKTLREQLSLNDISRQLHILKETVFDEEIHDRIETASISTGVLVSAIDDFIDQENKEKVYYTVRDRKGLLELKSNLVESRNPCGDLVRGYESVIMTSATLTTGGGFGFIKDRLGIPDFKEMIAGSPFDFRKQSLLYLNRDLPTPYKDNDELFQQESLRVIEKLVHASRGRALVLFTSYRHLTFVSNNIAIEYSFKTQGDMPPAKLIEWFRDTPNSVLLATATFWQGIDIKGECLSLVIIVRMPFGSPGDPVYDERCRRLGTRWFADLALPSAILLLRQGFGRLIRGVDDYGVVAILDSRLLNSSYGSTIISSLPEIDIIHSVTDVKNFFDELPPLREQNSPPFHIPRQKTSRGKGNGKN